LVIATATAEGVQRKEGRDSDTVEGATHGLSVDTSLDPFEASGRSQRERERPGVHREGPGEGEDGVGAMAKKVRERMVSYATYGVVLCLVLKSIFSLRTYVMLSRSFDADEGTMNGLKLNLVPITEVASDVSPLDLFLRHAKEPVIVKGALHGQPLMRADNVVEYVAQVCRDSYIDTVVYSKEVSSWAGHTDEKLMRIKDYYASYVKNSSNEELRYATSATFGMPFMCPALQHDMLVPGLASKPLPTGGAFRNYAQPTIFMGPAWSRSELHIDMMLMPFWLGVYAGTKRFRVIAFEDNLEHFGVDRGGFGSGRILSPSGKALEIFDPDVQEFPELQDVRIYEGEVKAGDVIYVPSGALHGILNTEATFAATSNSLWPPLTSHYAEVSSFPSVAEVDTDSQFCLFSCSFT